MNPVRIPVEPAPLPGNAAIRARYPIDLAKWLWHPDDGEGEVRVARFFLEFDSGEAETLCFDVSADQRFVLSCDGREFGRGPDRSELGGWSFHRYKVSLKPGPHRLEALVWWLSEATRPRAQVSARPAFALVGLDNADKRLSTGNAPWKVRRVHAWKPLPKNGSLAYHVIGCGFEINGGSADGPAVEPVVVAEGGDSLHGVPLTPWRCEPSPLPEQSRPLYSGGRLRGPVHPADPALCRGETIKISPGQERVLLWDFEDYVCGYSRVILRGGADAVVEMEWAESLYEDTEPSAHSPKGHRGEHEGKTWLGFGDRVLHPGGEQAYESLWWRSGRWLRILVRTGAEPLEILDARPRRTGHPFERRWAFDCDQELAGMLDLCERGLRCSVHETFVDCPYYEQMQYLGDTRVQAVVWLAATGDPRPVRRALELFDRSRWFNGFHAERCPTHEVQMSATYSLVFPPMLRDFTWWCDEPGTVRRLLPGMRSALEHCLACVDDGGHIAGLPGWLFVDWVHHPAWKSGVPGGTGAEITSPIALHLPVALDAAAQVEDAHGDPHMAQRWRHESRRVLGAILQKFGGTDLLSDDQEGTQWSEHAQALALDCRELPVERRLPLLRALADPPEGFAKASVYFSHHLHEALLKAGETDAVWRRFTFWKKLVDQGFLTTVEAPEPSRSDCHGWGAHPLYHFLTAIAGIRPACPGFRQVRVTPRFGPLKRISATVPHPLGEIKVDFTRDESGNMTASVATPVPGVLVWRDKEIPLAVGQNQLP